MEWRRGLNASDGWFFNLCESSLILLKEKRNHCIKFFFFFLAKSYVNAFSFFPFFSKIVVHYKNILSSLIKFYLPK
jgi:hypothetical protein